MTAARPLARRAPRTARTRASWPGTSGGARSRASAGARAPSSVTLCPWPVTWLPPHVPGPLPARSGQSVRPAVGPAPASDLVPRHPFATALGPGPRGDRFVEAFLTEGPGVRGRALEARQQLLQRPPRAVDEHHLVVADAVAVLAGQDDDSRHGCLLVRRASLPAMPGAD